MKILVLAGHHVRELLPYRECADVMRKALAELALGQIQQPLRTIVRPRDAAGFMGLMPAYSPGAGYGLKAICITPGNPAIGKDAHQGGVLLFGVHTGEPLALVNASAVTEIRTAATSLVRARSRPARRIPVSGLVEAMACACARACTPVPMMASSAARGLASSSVATAEVAAVLISVTADALTRASGSPVCTSNSSTPP